MRVELDGGSAPALGPAPRPRAPVRAGVKRPKSKLKSWYLKQLHTWHWISAAVSLIGMLLFAITGLTLNHAAAIGAEPKVSQRSGTLAPSLMRLLRDEPRAVDSPLPPAIADAVDRAIGLDAHSRSGEWSASEVYVSLPRPGGDAWLTVNRTSGAITAEVTDRGWISYLNDLHKGRNSGIAWFWFIDLFAGACILFTLTGLLLLQLHARNRPSTWPLIGVGMAIPVLIALFFIH